MTIIWIEHDMQMIADLADRIHVLDYGRTIAEGIPETVLSNPAVLSAYIGTPDPEVVFLITLVLSHLVRKKSAPNCLGRLHDQRQFGTLIVFGEGIPGDSAGEAALRADGKTIEINIACRLVRPPLQCFQAFEYRCLGAYETEHDAFVFRHEAKRFEITRARRIIFEQEVIDVGIRKKALGH